MKLFFMIPCEQLVRGKLSTLTLRRGKYPNQLDTVIYKDFKGFKNGCAIIGERFESEVSDHLMELKIFNGDQISSYVKFQINSDGTSDTKFFHNGVLATGTSSVDDVLKSKQDLLEAIEHWTAQLERLPQTM